MNPAIARKVIGLFHLNERVVYFGQWQEGLLLMSPVGATNVGSIKVNCDEVGNYFIFFTGNPLLNIITKFFSHYAVIE